ncbi:exonuclease SbcC [Bacillus ectoiniformans]|uniref:AAA family ATPase n=1 Tax=Bacillus ectoiniformans TaxID=1494429 RepID=UPI00195C4A26|nr:SMC family ATPase [Bacillus ectoiniformans]MBM7650140.1 exonuclease SbcC [Bacillus ectoiniformans]
MKPILLTMQAFGPYAGKEVIDFNQLESRTMFVISGKTGSGKTTIFDGISFAIYGRASGEERSGSELRSQFAKDQVPTEVSLQFSLRNRTYLIQRSPQQEKRKARGDGFTTVNAKAELYLINEQGEKEILAANVREVDEKIKDLMQLDANQFRQILMIPQGEFRKLLVSDSKEKEQILQKLFHTEFYKKIEEKLKKQASELKQRVESDIHERGRLLKGIQPASNEMIELLAKDAANEELILERLMIDQQQITKESEEGKERIDQLQEKRDLLKKEYDQAERVVEQLNQQERLKQEYAMLQEKSSEIKNKQEEIVWAEKAVKLALQEAECFKLSKAAGELEKNRKEIAVQLQTAQVHMNQAETALEQEKAKETEREEANEHVMKLTSLKEAVYSLDKEKSILLEAQERVHALNNEKEALQKKYEAAEQHAGQVEKKLSELDQVQKDFYENEKLEQKLQSARQIIVKAAAKDQECKELTKEQQLLTNAASEINDRYEKEKAAYEGLEKKWHKHQAGILARSLKAGETCPVCGSTDHPEYASEEGDLPSEEEMNAAKMRVNQLDHERQGIETKRINTDARLTLVQEALDELVLEVSKYETAFSLDKASDYKQAMTAQIEECEQRLKTAKGKLEQKPILLKEKETYHGAKRHLLEAINDCQQKESEMKDIFMSQKYKVDHMLEAIPESIRIKKEYDQALLEAQKRKQYLQDCLEKAIDIKQKAEREVASIESSLKEIQQMADKMKENLEAEKSVFKELMAEQNFDGYKHYEESKRTEEQIKMRQQEINRYNEDLRSVGDRLKDLSQQLQHMKRPDLEKMRVDITKAENQIEKEHEEWVKAVSLIRDYDRIRREVEEVNARLKEQETAYRVIGHLYEMAHGNNVHRLTFERYVLASFLDEILQVANERLVKMTGGRYQMLRKTDRAKGNVQSGLELLTFDQYTGQERHVKTLSGGESFKAALALALGLAEVVQQHAGGVSLETMFIDEGFGTLDPESLDQAIEALMDIQSSGRLVGVISHVPELKERIDARLEVVSTQTGSYTSFEFYQ